MSEVKFIVNGDPHQVSSDVSSNTSLLDYIRKTLELPGTKYMCKSGRCGACLVSVDKGSGESIQAVNSCLVSVASCHNWDITTIEKIGNRSDGYHAIQTTLRDKNGTQCGYCTPGWVVALYSLLMGKGEMTMREIEQSLGSNICRCTGYRPILDALKTFGKDAAVSRLKDIEDLKICCKKGNKCRKDTCDDANDWCIVKDDEFAESTVISFTLKDGKEWFRVEILDDIFTILKEKGTSSYMLINGNTGRGLVSISEFPDVLIDISGISALKTVVVDQNMVIGAGVTISEMMNAFTTYSTNEGFTYLEEFNGLLKYFANIPVKNNGTVGGNLMLAHKNHGVVSDLVIIFDAVGATVTVLDEDGVETNLTMANFMKEEMTGKVLINVLLPPLSSEYKVVVYKIAGKAENAGSILCAGFMYRLDLSYKVLECRIAYGLTYLTRATNTERYLLDKTLFTNDTLQGAITILTNELIVTYKAPATSAKYRKNLAIGLFYKSLLSICPPTALGTRYRSGAIDLRKTRPTSQGRQIYDTDSSLYPLCEPIPKIEGMIQCAGEATFTDDIPAFPYEVYAVFVLSTVAVGKIASIDASTALALDGVLAFYSVKDIPGLNSFTAGVSPASTTNEEVLCDGEVKYYNQPIGIIVAETQYLAEKAAKLVTAKYTNVSVPVVDIVHVTDDPKRTTLYVEYTASETGTDVTNVIEGELTIRGQYHACMETLVCVSHPTEEGIQVYTSSQHIDAVQVMTARALNVPQHTIDVHCRRVGGSYGYKISRSTQIAVACNLVVHKLNRPCRFIQAVKTNMKAVGKRLPCHAKYNIKVNDSGVIQSNVYKLFEDNGYLFNEPFAAFTLDCYSGCYVSTKWTYQVYNSTTDTPSNTWCRSPGTLESTGFTEWMMEHIAYKTGLDPMDVRMANLDTDEYAPIQEMYENLKTDCLYTERKAAVDTFNEENRWKKRAIRFACMIWNPPAGLPLYLDINIGVYSGDGTVVITHTGIEMGQGINTKAAQVCAYVLGIPVDYIKIKPPETTGCPNGFVTGASVASLNVTLGVQRCCEALLAKLEPVKETMDNPTWPELVDQAFTNGVDLQTHAFVNVNDNISYHVHGVACVETEIDIITGEYQILRVDLAEDVGQSVSPGIDIGQIEGAFVMGQGYWTSERLVFDKSTGEMLVDSLNQYWVPQALDIPQDFRIYFRKNSYTTDAILGAKATGEPAACLGVGVPIALRAAIVAARSESSIDSTDWFNIDGPYTVEQVNLACATRLTDFKFS